MRRLHIARRASAQDDGAAASNGALTAPPPQPPAGDLSDSEQSGASLREQVPPVELGVLVADAEDAAAGTFQPAAGFNLQPPAPPEADAAEVRMPTYNTPTTRDSPLCKFCRFGWPGCRDGFLNF